MKRRTTPREPPVAARPITVSQHTCEALLGVPRRTFLEWLLPALERVGVPVIRAGKLRLVRVDDVERALPELGCMPATDDDDANEEIDRDDDAPVRSVDDVLASYGRRRIA